MTPPDLPHEIPNDVLVDVVKAAADVTKTECVNTGHTRLHYRGKGGEPDAAFYFGEPALQIRGVYAARQPLDMDIYPAPNLVIEVDSMSDSLWRQEQLYPNLGVPECWVLGERLAIRHLEAGQYVDRAASLQFPWLTTERISKAIADFANPDIPSWKFRDTLRRWARAHSRSAERSTGDTTPQL